MKLRENRAWGCWATGEENRVCAKSLFLGCDARKKEEREKKGFDFDWQWQLGNSV